ncbi:UNVERIFIED_CONTAM: hypothetical protein HHA_269075 [Hammondia hammondi]|eukprot:XP_008882300.1 hypothetical protein HHA_269075 [Hammondia hammondi]
MQVYSHPLISEIFDLHRGLILYLRAWIEAVLYDLSGPLFVRRKRPQCCWLVAKTLQSSRRLRQTFAALRRLPKPHQHHRAFPAAGLSSERRGDRKAILPFEGVSQRPDEEVVRGKREKTRDAEHAEEATGGPDLFSPDQLEFVESLIGMLLVALRWKPPRVSALENRGPACIFPSHFNSFPAPFACWVSASSFAFRAPQSLACCLEEGAKKRSEASFDIGEARHASSPQQGQRSQGSWPRRRRDGEEETEASAIKHGVIREHPRKEVSGRDRDTHGPTLVHANLCRTERSDTDARQDRRAEAPESTTRNRSADRQKERKGYEAEADTTEKSAREGNEGNPGPRERDAEEREDVLSSKSRASDPDGTSACKQFVLSPSGENVKGQSTQWNTNPVGSESSGCEADECVGDGIRGMRFLPGQGEDETSGDKKGETDTLSKKGGRERRDYEFSPDVPSMLLDIFIRNALWRERRKAFPCLNGRLIRVAPCFAFLLLEAELDDLWTQARRAKHRSASLVSPPQCVAAGGSCADFAHPSSSRVLATWASTWGSAASPSSSFVSWRPPVKAPAFSPSSRERLRRTLTLALELCLYISREASTSALLVLLLPLSVVQVSRLLHLAAFPPLTATSCTFPELQAPASVDLAAARSPTEAQPAKAAKEQKDSQRRLEPHDAGRKALSQETDQEARGQRAKRSDGDSASSLLRRFFRRHDTKAMSSLAQDAASEDPSVKASIGHAGFMLPQSSTHTSAAPSASPPEMASHSPPSDSDSLDNARAATSVSSPLLSLPPAVSYSCSSPVNLALLRCWTECRDIGAQVVTACRNLIVNLNAAHPNFRFAFSSPSYSPSSSPSPSLSSRSSRSPSPFCTSASVPSIDLSSFSPSAAPSPSCSSLSSSAACSFCASPRCSSASIPSRHRWAASAAECGAPRGCMPRETGERTAFQRKADDSGFDSAIDYLRRQQESEMHLLLSCFSHALNCIFLLEPKRAEKNLNELREAAGDHSLTAGRQDSAAKPQARESGGTHQRSNGVEGNGEKAGCSKVSGPPYMQWQATKLTPSQENKRCAAETSGEGSTGRVDPKPAPQVREIIDSDGLGSLCMEGSCDLGNAQTSLWPSEAVSFQQVFALLLSLPFRCPSLSPPRLWVTLAHPSNPPIFRPSLRTVRPAFVTSSSSSAAAYPPPSRSDSLLWKRPASPDGVARPRACLQESLNETLLHGEPGCQALSSSRPDSSPSSPHTSSLSRSAPLRRPFLRECCDREDLSPHQTAAARARERTRKITSGRTGGRARARTWQRSRERARKRASQRTTEGMKVEQAEWLEEGTPATGGRSPDAPSSAGVSPEDSERAGEHSCMRRERGRSELQSVERETNWRTLGPARLSASPSGLPCKKGTHPVPQTQEGDPTPRRELQTARRRGRKAGSLRNAAAEGVVNNRKSDLREQGQTAFARRATLTSLAVSLPPRFSSCGTSLSSTPLLTLLLSPRLAETPGPSERMPSLAKAGRLPARNPRPSANVKRLLMSLSLACRIFRRQVEAMEEVARRCRHQAKTLAEPESLKESEGRDGEGESGRDAEQRDLSREDKRGKNANGNAGEETETEANFVSQGRTEDDSSRVCFSSSGSPSFSLHASSFRTSLSPLSGVWASEFRSPSSPTSRVLPSLSSEHRRIASPRSADASSPLLARPSPLLAISSRIVSSLLILETLICQVCASRRGTRMQASPFPRDPGGQTEAASSAGAQPSRRELVVTRGSPTDDEELMEILQLLISTPVLPEGSVRSLYCHISTQEKAELLRDAFGPSPLSKWFPPFSASGDSLSASPRPSRSPLSRSSPTSVGPQSLPRRPSSCSGASTCPQCRSVEPLLAPVLVREATAETHRRRGGRRNRRHEAGGGPRLRRVARVPGAERGLERQQRSKRRKAPWEDPATPSEGCRDRGRTLARRGNVSGACALGFFWDWDPHDEALVLVRRPVARSGETLWPSCCRCPFPLCPVALLLPGLSPSSPFPGEFADCLSASSRASPSPPDLVESSSFWHPNPRPCSSSSTSPPTEAKAFPASRPVPLAFVVHWLVLQASRVVRRLSTPFSSVAFPSFIDPASRPCPVRLHRTPCPPPLLSPFPPLRTPSPVLCRSPPPSLVRPHAPSLDAVVDLLLHSEAPLVRLLPLVHALHIDPMNACSFASLLRRTLAGIRVFVPLRHSLPLPHFAPPSFPSPVASRSPSRSASPATRETFFRPAVSGPSNPRPPAAGLSRSSETVSLSPPLGVVVTVLLPELLSRFDVVAWFAGLVESSNGTVEPSRQRERKRKPRIRAASGEPQIAGGTPQVDVNFTTKTDTEGRDEKAGGDKAEADTRSEAETRFEAEMRRQNEIASRDPQADGGERRPAERSSLPHCRRNEEMRTLLVDVSMLLLHVTLSLAVVRARGRDIGCTGRPKDRFEDAKREPQFSNPFSVSLASTASFPHSGKSISPSLSPCLSPTYHPRSSLQTPVPPESPEAFVHLSAVPSCRTPLSLSLDLSSAALTSSPAALSPARPAVVSETFLYAEETYRVSLKLFLSLFIGDACVSPTLASTHLEASAPRSAPPVALQSVTASREISSALLLSLLPLLLSHAFPCSLFDPCFPVEILRLLLGFLTRPPDNALAAGDSAGPSLSQSGEATSEPSLSHSSRFHPSTSACVSASRVSRSASSSASDSSSHSASGPFSLLSRVDSTKAALPRVPQVLSLSRSSALFLIAVLARDAALKRMLFFRSRRDGCVARDSDRESPGEAPDHLRTGETSQAVSTAPGTCHQSCEEAAMRVDDFEPARKNTGGKMLHSQQTRQKAEAGSDTERPSDGLREASERRDIQRNLCLCLLILALRRLAPAERLVSERGANTRMPAWWNRAAGDCLSPPRHGEVEAKHASRCASDLASLCMSRRPWMLQSPACGIPVSPTQRRTKPHKDKSPTDHMCRLLARLLASLLLWRACEDEEGAPRHAGFSASACVAFPDKTKAKLNKHEAASGNHARRDTTTNCMMKDTVFEKQIISACVTFGLRPLSPIDRMYTLALGLRQILQSVLSRSSKSPSSSLSAAVLPSTPLFSSSPSLWNLPSSCFSSSSPSPSSLTSPPPLSSSASPSSLPSISSFSSSPPPSPASLTSPLSSSLRSNSSSGLSVFSASSFSPACPFHVAAPLASSQAASPVPPSPPSRAKTGAVAPEAGRQALDRCELLLSLAAHTRCEEGRRRTTTTEANPEGRRHPPEASRDSRPSREAPGEGATRVSASTLRHPHSDAFGADGFATNPQRATLKASEKAKRHLIQKACMALLRLLSRCHSFPPGHNAWPPAAPAFPHIHAFLFRGFSAVLNSSRTQTKTHASTLRSSSAASRSRCGSSRFPASESHWSRPDPSLSASVKRATSSPLTLSSHLRHRSRGKTHACAGNRSRFDANGKESLANEGRLSSRRSCDSRPLDSPQPRFSRSHFPGCSTTSRASPYTPSAASSSPASSFPCVSSVSPSPVSPIPASSVNFVPLPKGRTASLAQAAASCESSLPSIRTEGGPNRTVVAGRGLKRRAPDSERERLPEKSQPAKGRRSGEKQNVSVPSYSHLSSSSLFDLSPSASSRTSEESRETQKTRSCAADDGESDRAARQPRPRSGGATKEARRSAACTQCGEHGSSPEENEGRRRGAKASDASETAKPRGRAGVQQRDGDKQEEGARECVDEHDVGEKDGESILLPTNEEAERRGICQESNRRSGGSGLPNEKRENTIPESSGVEQTDACGARERDTGTKRCNRSQEGYGEGESKTPFSFLSGEKTDQTPSGSTASKLVLFEGISRETKGVSPSRHGQSAPDLGCARQPPRNAALLIPRPLSDPTASSSCLASSPFASVTPRTVLIRQLPVPPPSLSAGGTVSPSARPTSKEVALQTHFARTQGNSHMSGETSAACQEAAVSLKASKTDVRSPEPSVLPASSTAVFCWPIALAPQTPHPQSESCTVSYPRVSTASATAQPPGRLPASDSSLSASSASASRPPPTLLPEVTRGSDAFVCRGANAFAAARKAGTERQEEAPPACHGGRRPGIQDKIEEAKGALSLQECRGAQQKESDGCSQDGEGGGHARRQVGDRNEAENEGEEGDGAGNGAQANDEAEKGIREAGDKRAEGRGDRGPETWEYDDRSEGGSSQIQGSRGKLPLLAGGDEALADDAGRRDRKWRAARLAGSVATEPEVAKDVGRTQEGKSKREELRETRIGEPTQTRRKKGETEEAGATRSEAPIGLSKESSGEEGGPREPASRCYSCTFKCTETTARADGAQKVENGNPQHRRAARTGADMAHQARHPCGGEKKQGKQSDAPAEKLRNAADLTAGRTDQNVASARADSAVCYALRSARNNTSHDTHAGHGQARRHSYPENSAQCSEILTIQREYPAAGATHMDSGRRRQCTDTMPLSVMGAELKRTKLDATRTENTTPEAANTGAFFQIRSGVDSRLVAPRPFHSEGGSRNVAACLSVTSSHRVAEDSRFASVLESPVRDASTGGRFAISFPTNQSQREKSVESVGGQVPASGEGPAKSSASAAPSLGSANQRTDAGKVLSEKPRGESRGVLNRAASTSLRVSSSREPRTREAKEGAKIRTENLSREQTENWQIQTTESHPRHTNATPSVVRWPSWGKSHLSMSLPFPSTIGEGRGRAATSCVAVSADGENADCVAGSLRQRGVKPLQLTRESKMDYGAKETEVDDPRFSSGHWQGKRKQDRRDEKRSATPRGRMRENETQASARTESTRGRDGVVDRPWNERDMIRQINNSGGTLWDDNQLGRQAQAIRAELEKKVKHGEQQETTGERERADSKQMPERSGTEKQSGRSSAHRPEEARVNKGCSGNSLAQGKELKKRQRSVEGDANTARVLCISQLI